MTNVLEGAWRQLAATENGEVIDHDDEITVEILGSTFIVKRNNVLEIEGTFTVDSIRNPRSIDWKDLIGADAGKVFKSFCVVQEDLLEFCAADEGMPRPKRLEPKQGHTIRRLVRLRSSGRC